MKLVDLDQAIFVPVVDEPHGGAVVEMKMTVGEFFGKFCQGFEPEIIEAIPMEWLRNEAKLLIESEDGFDKYIGETLKVAAKYWNLKNEGTIGKWQKEQEAQDG